MQPRSYRLWAIVMLALVGEIESAEACIRSSNADDPYFIRAVRTTPGHLTFLECSIEDKKNCRPFLEKDSFSEQQLQRIHRTENREAAVGKTLPMIFGGTAAVLMWKFAPGFGPGPFVVAMPIGNAIVDAVPGLRAEPYEKNAIVVSQAAIQGSKSCVAVNESIEQVKLRLANLLRTQVIPDPLEQMKIHDQDRAPASEPARTEEPSQIEHEAFPAV